jgi:CRP-like cAMP-binding protein
MEPVIKAKVTSNGGSRAMPIPKTVLHSFNSFACYSEPERLLLQGMFASPTTHEPGTELISTGAPFDGPRLILSGWAYSAVNFVDGRRQIIDFYLPSDVMGLSTRPGARAPASFFALSKLVTVPADPLVPPLDQRERFPGLWKACQAIEGRQEFRHVQQIVRLGRQLARERMASLLPDIYRRLERLGIKGDEPFEMPATQEILGDALGLSTVHINRTLQDLRHEGLIRISHGSMQVLDLPKLSALAGEMSYERMHN